MCRLGESQPSPSLECLRERCLPCPRETLEDDEGQAGVRENRVYLRYLGEAEKELEVRDERVDEEGEVADAQVRDGRHAVLHLDRRTLPRLREGLLSRFVDVVSDFSPYPGREQCLGGPLPLLRNL